MPPVNIKLPEIETSFSPTVILIRPQLGENIGAVARAMKNFGWTELRIVEPRDGWPNTKAVAAASGAGSILQQTKIFKSTERSCEDLNFVFATTARQRGLTKDIFSPEEAMTRSREIMLNKQKVGVVFGPERSGLENSDLCFANSIISIPVNPHFSSLNLAQSVIIIAYEWFKIGYNELTQENIENVISFASRLEIEHLRNSLHNSLSSTNYFWPEDKISSLQVNLDNLLGRLPLTSADVRTLHGIVKSLTKERTSIK